MSVGLMDYPLPFKGWGTKGFSIVALQKETIRMPNIVYKKVNNKINKNVQNRKISITFRKKVVFKPYQKIAMLHPVYESKSICDYCKCYSKIL